MAQKTEIDPMAEFKNIDYRKINEAVPGIHTEPLHREDKMHITIDGQTFHVSQDKAAICAVIKMLCEKLDSFKDKPMNKKDKSHAKLCE